MTNNVSATAEIGINLKISVQFQIDETGKALPKNGMESIYLFFINSFTNLPL